MSAPVGPTGLAAECHGGSGGPLRVALSGGALWTDLTLGGGTALTEQSISASLSAQLWPRLTLVGGVGGLLGGSIGGTGLGGGVLVFAGASYRALAPRGAVPLVSVAVTASAAHARPAGRPFVSTDVKLSVTAAWPIARAVAPYLTAAAFGGPVFYRGEVSGDRYHYQVIAGVTAALPRGLDLFLEGSPVGARALSGGAGFSY